MAVAELRNLESSKAASLLRWCNVVCALLGLGIAGCWHIYIVVTCSDATVDEAEAVDVDDAATTGCMAFFPRLSTTIVALYIMCVLR